MKIAILHQDLEYAEEILKTELEKSGFIVNLFDVRLCTIEDIKTYDVLLNRVFASVANRNFKDNFLTLALLEQAESKGVQCINSFTATKCDYSKSYAAKKLLANNVNTPQSFFINLGVDISEIISFVHQVGYPVVVKRDMGGRAKDIYLVENEQSLKKTIAKVLTPGDDGYAAGYVVQEFVKSTLSHDYRVSIVANKFLFANARSLMPTEGSLAWVASTSSGSQVEQVNPPQEIIDLALNSTNAIGAQLNEVDIIVGKDGPYIIENNPTPNFTLTSSTRRLMLDKTIEVLQQILPKTELVVTT